MKDSHDGTSYSKMVEVYEELDSTTKRLGKNIYTSKIF